MKWKKILKNKPFYGDRECPRCGSKMMTTFPNKAASLTGKDEVSYCTKCGYTEDEGTESTDSPSLIKRDVYEGDPKTDKYMNKELREYYDWFMTVMSGKKHPKGSVHDNNLMYNFMNHVSRAFEDDKSSREYQIANRMFETSKEREDITYELYELISSKIASEDRQVE